MTSEYSLVALSIFGQELHLVWSHHQMFPVLLFGPCYRRIFHACVPHLLFGCCTHFKLMGGRKCRYCQSSYNIINTLLYFFLICLQDVKHATDDSPLKVTGSMKYGTSFTHGVFLQKFLDIIKQLTWLVNEAGNAVNLEEPLLICSMGLDLLEAVCSTWRFVMLWAS